MDYCGIAVCFSRQKLFGSVANHVPDAMFWNKDVLEQALGRNRQGEGKRFVYVNIKTDKSMNQYADQIKSFSQ